MQKKVQWLIKYQTIKLYVKERPWDSRCSQKVKERSNPDTIALIVTPLCKETIIYCCV